MRDATHVQQTSRTVLGSLLVVQRVRLPLAPRRASIKTFQPSTSNEELPEQDVFALVREVSVKAVKGYTLYSAEVQANLSGLTIDLEIELEHGETYRDEYLNAAVLGSRDGFLSLAVTASPAHHST